MQKLITICTVFGLMPGLSASLLQASYIYPLEIFTSNGSYSDELDLFIEVSDGEADQVDFTFHNESLFNSSIARIYFADDSLLEFICITEGGGTFFSQPAIPGDLPGGNLLELLFVTTEGLSFHSEPPGLHNGIGPDEWLRITFDINSGTFPDVINGLNTSNIRIATHVIGLPDGSSESAIATECVPEPATVALLALGSLSLLRRKRSKYTTFQ